MTRLLIVVALIWIALMPPLFTGGACTAEYEEASALITAPANREQIKSPAAAMAFLQSKGADATLLTEDDCAQHKPRFLWQCGRGTLVYADVPVRNKVCRFYRDDRTFLRLQYDKKDRLSGLLSEMKPYKFLALPWGWVINWAK